MSKPNLTCAFHSAPVTSSHEDFQNFFKGMECTHAYWSDLQTLPQKKIEDAKLEWCDHQKHTLCEIHLIDTQDLPRIGCRFVIAPSRMESPRKHIHDLIFYGGKRVGYTFQQIPKNQKPIWPDHDKKHGLGLWLADSKAMMIHNLGILNTTVLKDVLSGDLSTHSRQTRHPLPTTNLPNA